MNITYILLIITVIIALFHRDKKFLYISIIITNIVGLSQGVINIVGLTLLCCFSIMTYLYFHLNNVNKVLKILFFIGVSSFIAGFAFHLIPGFFNILVLNKVHLSELSRPFSMFLNFDKTMSALILYSISNFYILEKTIDVKSLKQTACFLLLCIAGVLIPAFISGYVKFDPKIPNVLLIWAINNLFFVCMAEEVIFRGFLQNTLKTLLEPLAGFNILGIGGKNAHIIIASLIFGLAHFQGGSIYIILATICALCYGYTYDKTNRIICAMMVHFGLNLFHLMLFSYPAANI
ncbi:CPBP family intramembrane glutamic endopeptidase [Candidatus Tisiphia endosymbiont of Empis tessellata]|uniref:CPBP family intramembrane glutamic endopeptidase n=1 Tax=Candidatus Tisiphia endosymbiont of Empis tessellata TaxID=3066259 RepID=UPI00313C60A5